MAGKTTRASPILTFSPPPGKRHRELFLQIGKRRFQVASVEDAVAKYTIAREASGFGASEMPVVWITTADGLHIYTISYNGRVWDIDQNGKSFPLDGLTNEQWVKSVTGSA